MRSNNLAEQMTHTNGSPTTTFTGNKKMMNLDEAVTKFTSDKKFCDLNFSSVQGNAEDRQIQVFTYDAKIWVDLPNTYEGYRVKMIVLNRNKQ